MVIILLLVWVVLIGLLWGGSLWFQGFIYESLPSDMYWRAPAAGTALTLFLVLWCWIDYKNPGRYLSFRDFSPQTSQQYDELRVTKRDFNNGQELRYKFGRDAQGLPQYRDQGVPPRPLPTDPDVIIVQDKAANKDIRFEPERDAQKKIVRRQGQSVRYLDERGRVMMEDSIGKVSTFHWGRFVGNLVINLFHLILWFACLWLLLRFQWSHALGLAVIFWLLMTLVIVPMLLTRVEAISPNANQPASAARVPLPARECA